MKQPQLTYQPIAIVVAVGGLLLSAAGPAVACPFCSVAQQTLSEETQSADAVVLAKLVREAATGTVTDPAAAGNPNTGTAKFKIDEVIRGDTLVRPGQEIDVVYFGPNDREQTFMITGIGGEKIDWITPLPLSPAAIDYARKLPSVAASGADRLAFFQDYLEHEDPLLAQDAYDEFGRAPYAELHELKPRMYHDKLVKWISDPEVSPSRRRLYFTMLGVCGTAADVPMLEKMIVSDYATKQPFVEQLVETGLSLGGPVGLPAVAELVKLSERRTKLGLDALVACYLTLRGGDGLDLIDEQFLKKPGVEYTHIYSTVMALRFHGDEPSSNVPRERLLASMRLLLDNPDFADQVPIDLSRWQDWSVLERLVAMFKASEKNAYIRQPVVAYLTVASGEPADVGARAKAALAELEKLDPEGVKQARSLAAFGTLARARGDGATTAPSGSSPAATNVTVAKIGASDATQGFGASAADVAADSSTKSNDIPDPTEFGDDAGKTQVEGQPSAEETESGTAAQTTNRPTTANTVNATAAPATATSTPPAVREVSKLVVVGVPLVAAAALMGVYWLILRYGAV